MLKETPKPREGGSRTLEASKEVKKGEIKLVDSADVKAVAGKQEGNKNADEA